jgi:HAD superfamily hydrolase (TIGR01509 family)
MNIEHPGAQSASIRAVAFDLDGLMFNTEDLYNEVGAELMGRRGLQIDRQLLRQMMGRPSSVALPLLIQWYGLSDTVEQLESETDAVFQHLLRHRLEPMPGLLELLAELDRRRIPKAITTSSRRAYVETVLELARLETDFAFILSAEDVTQGKPSPEIYAKAAQRFGLPASAVMVLEDSEIGCRAAVAADAFTVAVPGSHSVEHEFAGVAFVADSLSDRRIYECLAQGSATVDRERTG